MTRLTDEELAALRKRLSYRTAATVFLEIDLEQVELALAELRELRERVKTLTKLEELLTDAEMLAGSISARVENLRTRVREVIATQEGRSK